MSIKQNKSKRKYHWVFIVYFVFLTIGIPWYWPEDNYLTIAGFPAWVFVAILVSFFTSLFTAFLLLKYPWNIETENE